MTFHTNNSPISTLKKTTALNKFFPDGLFHSHDSSYFYTDESKYFYSFYYHNSSAL